jgi:hypothetical protein
MPDEPILVKVDIAEIHRQQYAHFGRMNDILYRLPVLFSTLIGGLWFFAFTQNEKNVSAAVVVLTFSALLSVVFYYIMERFRRSFSSYIDNINKLDGEFAVSLKVNGASGGWSTIRWIQFSLQVAFVGSVINILLISIPEIMQLCKLLKST